MNRTMRVCSLWMMGVVVFGSMGCTTTVEVFRPIPLPTGLHGHRTHLIDKRLYVFGGYGRNSIRLDPQAREWVDVAPMHVRKVFFSSAVVDKKIYAIGGSEDGQDAVIERYDPKKDRWKVLLRSDKLPKTHFASAAIGHQIYIVGGFPDSHVHMHVFDTRTGKLADAPPLPNFARGDHFHFMANLNGKLHVLGGIRFKGDRGMLDQHWALHGQKWLKRAAMPHPSFTKAGAYGVVQGKLYLFEQSGQLHHVYDPKTDRWSGKLAPIPAWLAMTTVVTEGDRLYVLGGIPGRNRPSRPLHIFDVTSNRWNGVE